MFCRHCGKEVKDKAVVCSGCGNPIGESVSGEPITGHPWNIPLFIGMILVGLAGIPGIVLGLIGLREPAKKLQGAVLMTIGILTTLFWGAALWGI